MLISLAIPDSKTIYCQIPQETIASNQSQFDTDLI